MTGTRVAVRLPDHVIAALDVRADELGATRADAIRDVLERWVSTRYGSVRTTPGT